MFLSFYIMYHLYFSGTLNQLLCFQRGRCSRDRTVVGFIAIYVIRANHH